MTRTFLVAALVGTLACGGEDAGPTFLDGFAPVDQGALVAPVTTCTSPAYPFTGLLLGFTSFPSACTWAADTALCGDVASSTTLTVSILRARLSSPDPAPIGPGTYAISLTGNPGVEPDGSLVAALVELTRTDATCGEPASYPEPTGGSVTITSVSAGSVAGNVDVSFSDGGRFQRSFTLPVCAFVPDVCALVGDACTAPSCCPTSTSCPG